MAHFPLSGRCIPLWAMITPADRLKTVEEYYFSRKLKEVRQMIAEGKPVINLGIGNPDLPPPPAVVERLQSAVAEEGVHGYQPYQGIAELREAMVAWMYRMYGTQWEAATQVLPLMGSKEGIFHISMAFLNPGDVVLMPDPGYPTYAAVSRLVGAEAMTYPLGAENDWQIDLAALSALPLDRVKLMWLNTPHMPTGQVQQEETLRGLIALAQQHNFLIVNDNPYSLILSEEPKSIFQVPGAKDICLELNSLSKSHHMPGWRVGWLTGNEHLLSTVLQVKSNQDSGMFKAVQLAAVEALNTPMEWHASQNQVYAGRKAAALRLLDALGCTPIPNQQGMFVWAKVPEGEESAEAFADRLLYTHHVFMPPGTIFGEGGKGYIRVSLCVPEGNYEEVISRVTKRT